MSARDQIKRIITKSASSPLTKRLKNGAQRLSQEVDKGRERLKQRQLVALNTGRKALALHQRVARETVALNLTLTAHGLTQLAALTQASRDFVMMTRAPLSPIALAELMHRLYGSPLQAPLKAGSRAQRHAAHEPHQPNTGAHTGAHTGVHTQASAEDDELEVEFFER